MVNNFDIGIGTNSWDVWVFQSGTFTNEGDLGYKNWVFSNTGIRSGEDGETVTFEPVLTEEEREEREPELIEAGAEDYLVEEVVRYDRGEDSVKGVVKELRTRFPSYNVMLINQETYDKSEDTQNMQGVVVEDHTASFGEFMPDTWDVWLFESGTITNPGDGGYENWAFGGNYERTDEDGRPDDEGKTVTFEPIG